MATTKKHAFLDTGTLTLAAAPVPGTVTPGPTLDMSLVATGTLSAKTELLAETNTITLEVLWQTSNDAGANWARVTDDKNQSTTVLATGTGGADVLTTTRINAPDAVYGCDLCRVALINRVVNGAAADTYKFGYDFVAAKSA